MTKIEQLQKFIELNKLEFTEGRRNSDLVVLCGYGLYIDATKEDIWDSIPEGIDGDYDELDTEFSRVFDYAEVNRYGNWWDIESNRKSYKLP